MGPCTCTGWSFVQTGYLTTRPPPSIPSDSWRREAGGSLGHGSVATREPQVETCAISVLGPLHGAPLGCLARLEISNPNPRER